MALYQSPPKPSKAKALDSMANSFIRAIRCTHQQREADKFVNPRNSLYSEAPTNSLIRVIRCTQRFVNSFSSPLSNQPCSVEGQAEAETNHISLSYKFVVVALATESINLPSFSSPFSNKPCSVGGQAEAETDQKIYQ
jgi:hypothetical protein